MTMLRRFLPACWLALLFSLAPSLARAADAAPNTLTPEEAAEGWLLLFDGESTFGWKADDGTEWKAADGALKASSGAQGMLNTTTAFCDYELSVEFQGEEQTNSGVFLRTGEKVGDVAKDCYELNIAPPENPFPTGSFVNRQKYADAKYAAGWRKFHVVAEGGKFTVQLDGATVLEYVDPAPVPSGKISLQYREGAIAFRNIKLKPLGLKDLFNGKDLAGWKTYAGTDKKIASVYSVTPEGALNVKDGPGQLESEGSFADFVFQIDVFSNGAGLNSGVFFRSIPGEFWNGYEAQVNNALVDGDPKNPKDFGTGAIYRRIKARQVVSKDFEWFKMTVIAQGPHISVWVNGYPVTDWTDARPPHDNPRNGLRTKAGTFIIQGHDPTTDLSFKNIRVAETKSR